MSAGTLAPPNPARQHQEAEGKSIERLALEEAGLTLEISEFVLGLANDFLKILVSQARQNRDWQKILTQTLTDTEIEQNTKVVHDKLERFGWKAPIGAVVGGTGPLRNDFDITGEQAQQAVQVLKACGRLVQCGRGRGKSLVVLTDKPLDDSVLGRLTPSRSKKAAAKKAPARTSTGRRTSLDVKAGPGMGKSEALAEAVVSAAGSDRSIVLILSDLVAKWAEEKRALEAQVTAARAAANAERLAELISANKALERKVEELDRVLLTKEEALRALEQALAEKDLTSWSS